MIGGGIVGAAAALATARLGLDVVLLERSSLSTAAGSSRGTARIYAPAAYPDDSYLGAGMRALADWRRLESAADKRLLSATGVLHVGGFAERQLEALTAAGVTARAIDAAEAERRFGVRVPPGAPVVHQLDAGVIHADRAWHATLAMARTAGAELRAPAPVRSVTDRGECVEVATEGGSLTCAAAILAAGPWTRGLLSAAGIECPLETSLQTVAYFDLPERSAQAVALIDYEGDEPYACWDPERGLKAALHARGRAHDPDDLAGTGPDAAALDRIAEWVAASYPGVAASPTHTETCMYTNAPGERFVVERHGRIVVGSACSGQGFQFAPHTGERLAGLAAEVASVALSPAESPR